MGKKGNKLPSGPKNTVSIQWTYKQEDAAPTTFPVWFTEALTFIPLLGSLQFPELLTPLPQSHDLQLHTESPHSNPDEKMPRAPAHHMSAMTMTVVEEEVGKSWERATAIPSGKQGKCVPGIPIWTWKTFIHGNLGWWLGSIVQLAQYYTTQTL